MTIGGNLLGGASALFLAAAAYAGQGTPPMAAPAAKPAANATSIASGETLFKRHCQTCHGATGVGDGPTAKTLKGKLPNLADKKTTAMLTDSEIHNLIVKGKKSEIGNMPPFDRKLKDPEIQDIISFVRTLSR